MVCVHAGCNVYSFCPYTAKTKFDNDVCYVRFVICYVLSTISTFLCCKNCVQGCCGDGI